MFLTIFPHFYHPQMVHTGIIMTPSSLLWCQRATYRALNSHKGGKVPFLQLRLTKFVVYGNFNEWSSKDNKQVYANNMSFDITNFAKMRHKMKQANLNMQNHGKNRIIVWCVLPNIFLPPTWFIWVCQWQAEVLQPVDFMKTTKREATGSRQNTYWKQ